MHSLGEIILEGGDVLIEIEIVDRSEVGHKTLQHDSGESRSLTLRKIFRIEVIDLA